MSAVANTYDYDWREAERHYRLALAADPVLPWARCFAACYLLAVGRFKEALREFETALEWVRHLL